MKVEDGYSTQNLSELGTLNPFCSVYSNFKWKFFLMKLTIGDWNVGGRQKTCAKTFENETLQHIIPSSAVQDFQISEKEKCTWDHEKKVCAKNPLRCKVLTFDTTLSPAHQLVLGSEFSPTLFLALSLIPLAKCPCALGATPNTRLLAGQRMKLALSARVWATSNSTHQKPVHQWLSEGRLLSRWRFSVGV